MTEAAFVFDRWSQQALKQVEAALAGGFPPNTPADLVQAMRYAVLDGGKRIRPLLVLAAAHAVQPLAVLPASLCAACAVELIHAYSLVHDDMPCMDNDVLRRGKPTVHVAYGEAQALLAGDALQALAFEWLTPDNGDIAPAIQARMCAMLARAAGAVGMAGGQAIDLAHVGQRMSEASLRDMHQRKTGAMLEVSVVLGAISAGATEAQLALLRTFGQAIGLAFQVVDDILDVTADSASLGKTAGKDAANDKPTFVSLMGLSQAQSHAQDLLHQALTALDGLGASAAPALRALAHKVVQRQH